MYTSIGLRVRNDSESENKTYLMDWKHRIVTNPNVVTGNGARYGVKQAPKSEIERSLKQR